MVQTTSDRTGGNHWTRRAVGIVAAVALLVGGATASYLLLDDDDGPETRVLGEAITVPPTTAATGGTEAPATTPASTIGGGAATTTTRPRTTTPGAPATTGATTTTIAGCRNSTDPRCGPFRWVGAVLNQPLTLQLRWSPAAPAVGQPVTFTLTVSDPDAPAEGGSAVVGYGDGPALEANPSPLQGCDRYGPWDLPAPRAGRWERVYTHSYQQTGTFEALFTQHSKTLGIPDCVDQQRKLADPWASTLTIRAAITVVATPVDRPAWTQPSDNAFSFEYQTVGQRGGASSMGSDAGKGVLAFEVQGVVVADSPPAALLRATLRNQRDFAVAFPAGLDVVVNVYRNGQLWQDVHLRDPGVTSLAPGQQVSVSANVGLPGFGSYTVAGQVSYVGT